MSFKIAVDYHSSETCPGVNFALHKKTYGRRMELNRKIADYNKITRSDVERRAMIWEEARTAAAEALNPSGQKQEKVLQIGVDSVSVSDPQDNPKFKLEVIRQIQDKAADLAAIEEKIRETELASFRPIYMDVYLHSVKGLQLEDDSALDYAQNMSKADKQRFYELAPSELIDEIFTELSKRIGMSEAEKQVFELPTTGGGPVEAKKTSTSAEPAAPANSTDIATAASPTS